MGYRSDRMQNKYKKITLDEIYQILDAAIQENAMFKYPMEIQEINGGIGIKMYSNKENILLCLYPKHPTSQVSLTRKGMRYIYPRRALRLRKNNLDDMMRLFVEDHRLFGITKMIELYLIEVIKQSYPDIIESVYLG